MPKEMFEIKQFMGGTLTSPSETDMPEESASYSMNIDPVSEDGKLTPVPADVDYIGGSGSSTTGITGTIQGSKFKTITDGAKRHVVFYDEDTENSGASPGINTITDFYENDGDAVIGTKTAISNTSVTMETNNKEVHIGVGGGDTYAPKWCGLISHKLFGESTDGLYLTDGTMQSPSLFTDMHQVVNIGDFLYGIEYEGEFVYKFNKAEQTFVRKSLQNFVGAGGISVRKEDTDGNLGLWVFDKNYSATGIDGKLYALTADDMSELFHVDLEEPGSPAEWDTNHDGVVDFIEVGEYGSTEGTSGCQLWFQREPGLEADHEWQNKTYAESVFLWNMDSPNEAGTKSPTNRTFIPPNPMFYFTEFNWCNSSRSTVPGQNIKSDLPISSDSIIDDGKFKMQFRYEWEQKTGALSSYVNLADLGATINNDPINNKTCSVIDENRKLLFIIETNDNTNVDSPTVDKQLFACSYNIDGNVYDDDPSATADKGLWVQSQITVTDANIERGGGGLTGVPDDERSGHADNIAIDRSGQLLFIPCQDGVRVFNYDNDGILTAVGDYLKGGEAGKVILTVDDLTPTPTGAWGEDETHNNVEPDSGGSGSGMRCTIVTHPLSGDPTFTITNAGTGYEIDDELVFVDPSESGSLETATLVVETVSDLTGEWDLGGPCTALGVDSTNRILFMAGLRGGTDYTQSTRIDNSSFLTSITYSYVHPVITFAKTWVDAGVDGPVIKDWKDGGSIDTPARWHSLTPILGATETFLVCLGDGDSSVSGIYSWQYDPGNITNGMKGEIDPDNSTMANKEYIQFDAMTTARGIASTGQIIGTGDATVKMFYVHGQTATYNEIHKCSMLSVHDGNAGTFTRSTTSQVTDANTTVRSLRYDTVRDQLIQVDADATVSKSVNFWNCPRDADNTIAFAWECELTDPEKFIYPVEDGTNTPGSHYVGATSPASLMSGSEIWSFSIDSELGFIWIHTEDGMFMARYMEPASFLEIPRMALHEADDDSQIGIIGIYDKTGHEDLLGNATTIQLSQDSGGGWTSYDSFNWLVNADRTGNTAVNLDDGEKTYIIALPATETSRCITAFDDTLFVVTGDDGAELSKLYHFTRLDDSQPEFTTIAANESDEFDISEGTICPTSATLCSVFAGNGVGKWMDLSYDAGTTEFSTATAVMISTLGIRLTKKAGDGFPTNLVSEDPDVYKNSNRVWYRASFLYDGYQESTLGDFGEDTETGNLYIESSSTASDGGFDVDVELNIAGADKISKRVSHIVIYRAVEQDRTDTDPFAVPTVFFRKWKKIELNTNFHLTSGSGSNPVWEVQRSRTLTDSATYFGASYEAITGISETLDNPWVNYGLSAQLNNVLFVADCFHPQVDDAGNYMFKSRPYSFNMFNVIADVLRIPVLPTAVASYQGRIWVFGHNTCLRIEPNFFYIEDEFEGAGCDGPDSFCITEYGMCFADKNNIYLHNGQTPVAIGDGILTGDAEYSWHNRDTSYPAKVEFDAKRNSFLVFFVSNTGDSWYCWAFNLARKRWDLWELGPDSADLGGTFSGKYGETFFCDKANKKITHYLGDSSSNKTYDWRSKKMHMGTNTQYKRFKRIRLTGDDNTARINQFLSSEGAVGATGANDGDTGYVYTLSGDNRKAKWVSVSITNEDDPIDSIGFVFRRSSPK